MAEVDTSSYPKPQAPLPILSQIGQYGAIQQQQIGIEKSKLDLMNSQFGAINSELSNLAANPNTTKEQAAQRLNNFAQTYKLPPEVITHMMTELQQAPDVKSFAEFALRRGMDVQQKINQTYGQNANVDTGQVIQPGIAKSPMQGGGFTPSGMPIQRQLPPETPVNVNGQQTALGPQPPVNAPGATSFPAAPPTGRLPVAAPAPVSGPISPTLRRTDMEQGAPPGATPQTPAQRIAGGFQATGPALGPAPLAEEGRKALTEDQMVAAQKMTAVKPAMEALKILPGLRSGPGTEPFNKAVAFLKANNIVPMDADPEKDSTVVYQEANKYLTQYLKGRGGRSDADLTAAEKSSPNVGTQLNPALLKLTKTAIAQDRIEAARPNAFTQGGRTDYQNYGEHRATFPQSIDDRAFGLDLDPEQSQKLVDSMLAKYKKNPQDREAVKFLRSYDIAKKQGFY